MRKVDWQFRFMFLLVRGQITVPDDMPPGSVSLMIIECINHGWETQGRKMLDGIPGKDPDGSGGGGKGY